MEIKGNGCSDSYRKIESGNGPGLEARRGAPIQISLANRTFEVRPPNPDHTDDFIERRNLSDTVAGGGLAEERELERTVGKTRYFGNTIDDDAAVAATTASNDPELHAPAASLCGFYHGGGASNTDPPLIFFLSHPPLSLFERSSCTDVTGGSILFFDKKVQRHFRKDGYKWKKAKDGKIVKEAHERLKVGGVDTLHCYYAHGEEDENFQRRSYWMLEEKLSHIVLVHYRDVKGDKIQVRYIKETAEGVQRSRETDEITPKSEIDSFASSSLNPSNFQHSQATDGTHLSSGQTAQSKNTDSAYSMADDFDWESFYNNVITFAGAVSFLHETEEIGPNFEMDNFVSPRYADMPIQFGEKSSNFGDDETGCNYWRASSSVAVEPSHASLGKRQRDSTASEEGASKATPHATTEEVDKDEEEEGNDINQVRKRTKVTCSQKSNSVAPSNDSEEATLAVGSGTAPPQVEEFNSAIQQGEVIAGNNPAAASDGVTNDATALSQAQQDDETTRLAAFRIADPTVAATSVIGPIHLNPCTIANVANQANVDVSNVVVVHVEGTTTSVPPVSVDVAMAPMGVQAPIGVLSEPMTFPEETIKGDGVFLNGAQTSEVVPPPVVLSPEEQASIEEWVSWHEAFNTLKDSIRNGARVLSSIEDLLPQGEAFTSYVDFRNTKVRSGLADILIRFLERVGDTDECLIGLSPYMRGMVFEELGILLYDMEHTPRVEVSEHRLLCWRDMINDVAALGVPVSSLIESLEKSRDTMFGLHLEEDKGILHQFVKVNKLEHVVELQRKELEAEKLKLKKLVRGSSKEIAACLQLAADHLSAGNSGSFEG
ncbi:hypothetical protein C1H46_006400 [Malus baccata]|uniref:CG-1 domain-containing protein n=1 Tax=Malus baccata TaxID=106549 RepID=A0A540NAB3_MALBA|nr:hypothetical protein C1H46_006400 [Malus baccata]